MSVKVRKKRNRLYLDIYVEGLRTWEALGLTITGDSGADKEALRLAGIARTMREQQIFSGTWGLQDRTRAKMALYAYLEKMGEGRNRQKDRVCKVLLHLAKFPGGKEIQLGQVSGKWFESFQDYLLKDRDLSESSAHGYAFAVRMALRKAVREGVLTEDPASGIKGISLPEPDREFLQLAEFQKLARVPIGGDLGAEVKRAFLFSCYTALRVSDLRSLKWASVEHTASGAHIIKKQAKTQGEGFQFPFT